MGLVSTFGNKTVVSEDFLNTALSPEELQTLVTNSKEDDRVTILRQEEGATSTSELEFTVTKDTFSSNQFEYQRTQMRSQIPGADEWIFVDTIEVPRLYSEMLFAYKGEFNQSDILQKQILENCR